MEGGKKGIESNRRNDDRLLQEPKIHRQLDESVNRFRIIRRELRKDCFDCGPFPGPGCPYVCTLVE